MKQHTFQYTIFKKNTNINYFYKPLPTPATDRHPARAAPMIGLL